MLRADRLMIGHNYLIALIFTFNGMSRPVTIRGVSVEHRSMQIAKATKVTLSKAKAPEPEREGNRYTRAARVLATDDTIDVKPLADRAFMSESTAARCLQAWQACVAALIEVGRLPDPANAAVQKAKAAKPKPVVKPAPAETTETTIAAVETVETSAGMVETTNQHPPIDGPSVAT
jgi:hypothetical protein